MAFPLKRGSRLDSETLIMKARFASVVALAVSFPICGAPAQPATVVRATPPASALSEANPAAGARDQAIYTPRLPTPTELTNAAAARGATIEKIEEEAAQITVQYRTPTGQTSNVVYHLLPVANPEATPAVASPASPPTMIAETPPATYPYEPAYGRGAGRYRLNGRSSVFFRVGGRHGSHRRGRH